MSIILPVSDATAFYKAYSEDAGFDLYVAGEIIDNNIREQDVEFKPNETKLILLKGRLCIPHKFWGLIVPRSSMRKLGFICQAVIDAYYTGELTIPVTWIAPINNQPITLQKDTRFAQLIIIPLPHITLKECSIEELTKISEGKRADKGLGSSGK